MGWYVLYQMFTTTAQWIGGWAKNEDKFPLGFPPLIGIHFRGKCQIEYKSIEEDVHCPRPRWSMHAQANPGQGRHRMHNLVILDRPRRMWTRISRILFHPLPVNGYLTLVGRSTISHTRECGIDNVPLATLGTFIFILIFGWTKPQFGLSSTRLATNCRI